MTNLRVPDGVGQTAIFIAWQRHAESQRPDALFRDPLASILLDELAGTPTFTHVGEVARRANHPQYFAVRTRFFDDQLLAAMRSGVRQVVTLAAGMDGRSARLECPPGTRWFELDLPEMTAFKRALLAQSGVGLRCDWRLVAADLTGDWVDRLCAAGFEPAQPTAWLVEGLLMYLTEASGDALVAQATSLSAPGSTILVEQLQAMMLGEEGKPARTLVESQGARWLSARDDIEGWLASHGWQVAQYAGSDPRISHGRSVDRLPACWVASGELSERASHGVRAATPLRASP